MSSVMERSEIPAAAAESRSKMFLRSNSFQRLCSLRHPLRLKGFKSNREALKSVFESLIVTTRGVIQSVTYRFLCFLFLTPFTRLLIRAVTVAVDAAGGAAQLSAVRLILRLTLSAIITTDKAEVECNKCDDDEGLDCKPAEEEPSVADAGVQTEVVPNTHSELESDLPPLDQFFDCKDDSSNSEQRPHKQLRVQFQENSLDIKDSGDDHGRSSKKQLAFGCVVYGCVLCSFGQLSVLAYLLTGATRIPPGLIFLISALGYIGYVMMRILFDQCYSSSKPSVVVKQQRRTPPPSSDTTVVALVARKEEQSCPTSSSSSKGSMLHPILEAVSKQVASVLHQWNNSSSKPLPQLPPINASRPRMSRYDSAFAGGHHLHRTSEARKQLPSSTDSSGTTISKMKIL